MESNRVINEKNVILNTYVPLKIHLQNIGNYKAIDKLLLAVCSLFYMFFLGWWLWKQLGIREGNFLPFHCNYVDDYRITFQLKKFYSVSKVLILNANRFWKVKASTLLSSLQLISCSKSHISYAQRFPLYLLHILLNNYPKTTSNIVIKILLNHKNIVFCCFFCEN